MNSSELPVLPTAVTEFDEPVADGFQDLEPTLMGLARRLRAALVPVEPRPGFLAQLADQLVAARPEMEAAARQKEQRLLWMAGVGGALYLAGLGFVSFRAAQVVGGRLTALVSSRGARSVIPGAPTAA